MLQKVPKTQPVAKMSTSKKPTIRANRANKRKFNQISKEKEGGSPTDELESNGKVVSAELIEDDDYWAPEHLTDQEKLSSQIGKFGLDTDLEKTTEERLDMLHHHFIKVREAGIFGEGDELLNEAERLGLKV
jgi:hypothetical protein